MHSSIFRIKRIQLPRNERTNLPALRQATQSNLGGRGRRLLFAGASQPVPLAAGNGSAAGSQQSSQPAAAAGAAQTDRGRITGGQCRRAGNGCGPYSTYRQRRPAPISGDQVVASGAHSGSAKLCGRIPAAIGRRQAAGVRHPARRSLRRWGGTARDFGKRGAAGCAARGVVFDAHQTAAADRGSAPARQRVTGFGECGIQAAG